MLTGYTLRGRLAAARELVPTAPLTVASAASLKPGGNATFTRGVGVAVLWSRGWGVAGKAGGTIMLCDDVGRCEECQSDVRERTSLSSTCVAGSCCYSEADDGRDGQS